MPSFQNRKSKGAKFLRECSPSTTCHVSRFMCLFLSVQLEYTSHDHGLPFRQRPWKKFNIKKDKVMELVGGGSVINGASASRFLISCLKYID